MDAKQLKVLLDSQDKAYRGALEIFMKQTSENVKSLQSTITDLQTSLEFSQKDLDDLKQELNNYKQGKKDDCETIKALKEELEESKKKIQCLEERVNYQEDYSRRNNLQIIGIEERPDGETWEQTTIEVSRLLEDKLQLPDL